MGTITSETSIRHPPVAMTERESATRAWSPEIRPLRFDFLFPLSQHHSPSSSPPSPFLAALPPRQAGRHRKRLEICISQSFTFLAKTGIGILILFSLYLFPSAAITLSHNRNDCYLTAAFSVPLLISFFLPLKGDPFCCHRRDESCSAAAANNAALGLPSSQRAAR